MPNRQPTELRRPQIADAALHIVATRGIAALSTRALADAVGLTTGALFKHFATREALLVGMAERVEELLAGTYPSADLPPWRRVRTLVEARLSLVADRAGVLTLVLSEQFALALPEEAAVVLRRAVGQTHAFVVAAIREGQASGELRSDLDPPAVAMLVLGAVQMTALSRRIRAVDATPDVFGVLDGLLRPPSPPGEPMLSRVLAPLVGGLAVAGLALAAPPAGLHPVSVPAPSVEGAPKEVAVVADLPAVKIVAITLRAGTPLPEHTASVPVTIQAAHGAATLTVAGAKTPLAPGAFVVLDANTPHAVTPDAAAPVTILVHHHKAGAP